MSRNYDYESELTGSRNEIAAVVSGVADGLLAGSIRLGDDDDAIVVDTPEEMALEIELEAEDDEMSLELELEWPRTAVDESTASATEDSPEESDDSSTPGESEDSSNPGESDDSSAPGESDDFAIPVGAADASEMFARFELFRDKAEEWRWRLRHRNGNIIATSGEGYTRKHNAQKGLRSVMQNAPGAEITEDSEN